MADENLSSGVLEVIREETLALRVFLGLNLTGLVFTIDLSPNTRHL